MTQQDCSNSNKLTQYLILASHHIHFQTYIERSHILTHEPIVSGAPSPDPTGHHMIRVMSEWLHRAAKLSLSSVGLLITTSIAAKTRLLLRRSTSHALMNRIAVFHTPQPAIILPSEDRGFLLA